MCDWECVLQLICLNVHARRCVAVVQLCINSYITIYAPHVSAIHSNCTHDKRNAMIVVYYNADWTIQLSRMHSKFFNFELILPPNVHCTFWKPIYSAQFFMMSWCHDIVHLLHIWYDVIALALNKKNEWIEHCRRLVEQHSDFWHVPCHLNNNSTPCTKIVSFKYWLSVFNYRFHDDIHCLSSSLFGLVFKVPFFQPFFLFYTFWTTHWTAKATEYLNGSQKSQHFGKKLTRFSDSSKH